MFKPKLEEHKVDHHVKQDEENGEDKEGHEVKYDHHHDNISANKLVEYG